MAASSPVRLGVRQAISRLRPNQTYFRGAE
jgi:hypothetical protein